MKHLLRALCLFSLFSLNEMAQGQVAFHVDFESPTYTLGPAHGQDNWSAQFGFNSISNAQAHSGTQSFLANYSGGTRPFETPTSTFDIAYGGDFYIEAWVYVVSG